MTDDSWHKVIQEHNQKPMTDNDELVERVARSIEVGGLDASPGTMAQAALSALRPGDTYNGHMWVPMEPSSAMLKAAASALSPEKRPTMKRVSVKKKHAIRYRAMLQAVKGGE